MYTCIKNKVTQDVIGISTDADSIKIAPNYVEAFVEAAAKNPQVDLFGSQLRWENAGDYASDKNKLLRYWEFLSSLNRQLLPTFHIPDASTAMRMSSYAAIGGFPPTSLGETAQLRKRMVFARAHGNRDLIDFIRQETAMFVPNTYLKTSSRRIIECMTRGYPPHHAWSSIKFSTEDDPIRVIDTQTLANEPLGKRTLLEMLNSMDRSHLNNHNAANLERINRSRKFARQVIGLPSYTPAIGRKTS